MPLSNRQLFIRRIEAMIKHYKWNINYSFWCVIYCRDTKYESKFIKFNKRMVKNRNRLQKLLTEIRGK